MQPETIILGVQHGWVLSLLCVEQQMTKAVQFCFVYLRNINKIKGAPPTQTLRKQFIV